MKKLPKNCVGHSMIEVLIAVLVLSIGLLGLAGLQATSLQFTHDAQILSNASILAYDIIERIHTNKSNASLYATGSQCGSATCCDPDAISETNDVMCWTQGIQDQLPGGTGTVAGPDADGFVTVTISWLERETGTASSHSWVFVP